MVRGGSQCSSTAINWRRMLLNSKQFRRSLNTAKPTLKPEPMISLKDKTRPLRVNETLPDPYRDVLKRRIGFGIFSAIMVASLAVIFNYEKVQSPVVSNTLYQLRKSPRCQQLLGQNIDMKGLYPWVYGKLHLMQGDVDIHFDVIGSAGVSGVVRLRADRANRNEEFFIHEWSLTVGGQQVDLLAENTPKIL